MKATIFWAVLCVLVMPSQNAMRRDMDVRVMEILEEIREFEAGVVERKYDNAGHPVNSDSGRYWSEAAAQEWLEKLNTELADQLNRLSVASWNYLTNLTEENAQQLTAVQVRETQWMGEVLKEGKKFLQQSEDFQNQTVVRMLKKLINGRDVPVADSEHTIQKITTLGNTLEGIYGNAKTVKDGKTYRIEPEFTELLASSRDYDQLKWAWVTWRDLTGPQMRPLYTELVAAMNEAAKDNDFDDVGQSMRIASFEEDNVENMVDKLYQEILPMYQELHAYVRRKLVEFYSEQSLDPAGPIPAHILGNMWAQEWGNIYDIVAPYPDLGSGEVTAAMVQQNYTPQRMFELAESFFVSLGLDPMTDIFWEKSMIVRPPDRPVQCHAAAEDFTKEYDFRIKMCTKVNGEYLQTVHHEMGHIEYFMLYSDQPVLFRGGANSAFHEAVGDTIALSVVTPEHLSAIGLMDEDEIDSNEDSRSFCIQGRPCTVAQQKEINFLMKTALNKVAFLPFGYLIDKWRWEVFRGNIDETNYNDKWWEYRENIQGVTAPVNRSENDFDPGAKYHVPANVPYIRYFLSFIGQFEFHKALCEAAGHQGALHQCDIYRSKEAGSLLRSALSLGSSQPWPDVMEVLTNKRQFDTDAIYEYFTPLLEWLREQNAQDARGW